MAREDWGKKMSSTPEGDAAGQWNRGTQQGVPPGAPSQGSAPGQEQFGSAPSQGSAPGQEQFGSAPSRGEQGQPQDAEILSTQRGSQPGRRTPVNEAATRVTWRRIFQYWVDAFLVSVVPYLVSIPFDRSDSTGLHIIGGIITFVLFIVIGFWYWIIRPHSHNGQTFAMQWFGLRVISKDGGPATTIQYFIRWISLIFDAFPWVWPLTGLLGLIVMVCSRYRQRGGDHLARTLVISSRWVTGQAPQYARDGGSDAVG
jgi:uncharacterized RDD family membrane protein YckC